MAKYKQKTKKAVAKRFKKTATGKILRSKAGRGHLFASKTSKRKRQLRIEALVTGGNAARLKTCFPGCSRVSFFRRFTMPRATNAPASRRRRKRRLQQARGFYGARSKRFRLATEAVDRAMSFAYKHRKLRKRDYRSLWINRLTAACRAAGITYSRFIEGAHKAGIALNRKMLSEIAIHDPAGFTRIVGLAKAAAGK